MTNNLKNFLEEEKKHFETYYCLSTIIVDIESEEEIKKWQKRHDTRLINFVLDLVEKEVEKEQFDGRMVILGETKISTIINKLRV